MDWILITGHFMEKDVEIVRDHDGGRYPSDHFPYMADLDWSCE
jgi:endonuclease/exonuclease/phosphatase family metal-dependent hydrolase